MQSYFKKLRESWGITRAEFAKRIGLSGPFIGQIENGTRQRVSKTALKMISNTFGVAEQWLVDGMINETYHQEIERIKVNPTYVAEKLDVPTNFIEAIFNRKISPSEHFFRKIIETSHHIKTHGGDNPEIYERVATIEKKRVEEDAAIPRSELVSLSDYDRAMSERDEAYEKIEVLKKKIELLDKEKDTLKGQLGLLKGIVKEAINR